MASSTPFIDVLTDEQKALVANKALKVRPSYFSPVIAATQVRTAANGTSDNTTDGLVQISADLEAVLILMPSDVKVALLTFIDQAMRMTAGPDEMNLMVEVLAVRQAGYSNHINPDVSATLIGFDDMRAAFFGFIDRTSQQTDAIDDPTGVIVPDLSSLFSALLEDFDAVAKPDALAVHDVIADTATVTAFSTSGLTRLKELLSWIKIIASYNI